MKIHKTPLEGLLAIEPDCFKDERGFFLETYQQERYKDAGITDTFVQSNHSRSLKGVLRGMHYQVSKPQAQIITIMNGSVYYVCVDLRQQSINFGKWHGIELSNEGIMQMYMAPGFAGGFCVLSDIADLHYKVSGIYDPNDEGGLLWSDPDIGIQWPFKPTNITDRDGNFPTLEAIKNHNFPKV
jgi:dTDP-4-dehydrorhamnose 3,5-epimerase